MALSLEEIVKKFVKPRRQSDGSYKCICPSHYDKEQSLSVANGKEVGKIVLYCHAGCDMKAILQEVGLTLADIGEDKPEITWRSKAEYFMKRKIEAVYDYTDEKGRYLYSKVRFEGKHIRYGVLDKDQDRMNFSVKNRPRTLYNLPALIKTIKDGFPVYIVEGEKDVETLRSLGLTATTCGGVQDWNRSYAKNFIGARVVILEDNDEPGKKLSDEIMKDLKHHAHHRKSLVTSTKEKGDVTDYIVKEGHSKDDLKALVDGTPGEHAPWLYQGGTESKPKTLINEDILTASILKTLEYIILKEQGTKGELIYVYDKGVYTRRSRNDIKAIIRKYIPVGLGKDDLFNKTANLLMYSGGNVHNFDELNSDESMINVENGLYDVNQRKLIPHSSKVLSTIQLNCSYPEEYREPPRWIQFMNELCSDEDGLIDEKLVDLLQEWTGLILSNVKVYRFKKCLVLHSLLGDTGKTVYMNVLGRLLGIQNTINIPLQKMSDRWSLGDIYGKRLIAVGDQQSNDIDDSSIFKQLTGGDAVYTEIKNEMGFNSTFNGGITVNCNDLPVFKDDKGGHIFDRLLLVHCRNVIPKEKRDGNLLDKLMEERDQIFRWSLIGLHRVMDSGYKFTQCESSDVLMREYRSRSDTFYRFIDDNCEWTHDKAHRIKKTILEDEYMKYCQMNGLQPLDKKNIKTRAEKIGISLGTVDGYRYYKGIKWKDFRVIYDPNR